MFLPTYDIATDRWRGPMSEMLLYAEHPHLPIHAALFSNFDGTLSVVVGGRNGLNNTGGYTVSLAGVSRAAASAMEIVLRPTGDHSVPERVTFEDTGNPITGIRWELTAEPAQPVI
jgi:hypothetical protein